MKPFIIRIRVKGTDKYVGPKSQSYALRSDQDLDRRPLMLDAYWFVPEKRAKVWTNRTDLRRVLSLASHVPWHEATFSEFEAVYPDGSTAAVEDVVKDPCETSSGNS